MSFKSIVFVLFTVFSWTLAQQTPIVPQIWCTQVPLTPHICRLRNIFLLSDQPRYNLISYESNDLIEVVDFFDEQLAVLSPDFCETFPRLDAMYAQHNQIEFIDQDAFRSCFYIETIDLSYNNIEVLPPTLLHNNFRLKNLNLALNGIAQISSTLLQRNINLEHINLMSNDLEAFPASVIENSPNLEWLFLHTNNIYELDSAAIIKNAPKLRRVMLNGNLWPCSQVGDVLKPFKDAGLSVEAGYAQRDRPFRMGEVEGYACIAGQ